MTNYLSKGMKYTDVINLLGNSFYEYADSSYISLSYEVEVVHVFYDLDPHSGTNLKIFFDKDSLLVKSELEKWE
jgi:hypothetical protein